MANGGLPRGQRPARWDLWNLAIVFGLSAVAACLLWTKMHSLALLDPAWWLQEMARFAQGQVPYRDYFWPYPPLAVFIFGIALRVFGQQFWVAQILIDVFSLAVMLGIYYWTKRLLPPRLQALNCLLVLAICATTQTYFSLFSFLTYGPALHVSATGLLLLWLGVLRYLEEPSASGLTLAAMGIGAGVAVTSKQESVIAVGAVFGMLALWERRHRFQDARTWIRHYAALVAPWFIPAAAIYAAVGWWAGFSNMMLSLQGNGLPKIACPWWPTGFGLFASASALGLAALVAGACTLVDAARWKAYVGGRRYALLLLTSLAGGGMYLVFVAANYQDAVFGSDPLPVKLTRLAPELLATSAVFRPVLWVMIVYWVYLFVRVFRAHARTTRETLGVLLALTIPVSLGLRSLFGSYISPYPEVPAMCYPFVVVLTAYLLLRWLRLPYGYPDELRISVPSRPAWVTAALMLAYIAVRVIGGYAGILSNSQFTRLESPAGVVHVREGEADREILSYVLAETSPLDPILELPYGGGVGFATGRPSYTFTTLWRQGVVPEHLQALDLKRLRDKPPKIVIAFNSENYGTYYGLKGNNACVFPSFVWKPDRVSWRPGFVYPAIRWIQENYRVDRRVGDWLLLRPRSG